MKEVGPKGRFNQSVVESALFFLVNELGQLSCEGRSVSLADWLSCREVKIRRTPGIHQKSKLTGVFEN